MDNRKLDIWVIAFFVILYGIVVFFSLLPKQSYLESLVLLSAFFTILVMSYFGGVVVALGINTIAVFVYGSYILYRNIVLGIKVEYYTFAWLIIIPLGSLIIAKMSLAIKGLQVENSKFKKDYLDLVTVDANTGLENSKTFYYVMNKYISLSIRYKISLTLMLVKLQYYNNIVGLIGEAKMKDFLKSMAQQLVVSARAEDSCYVLDDGCTFALVLFTDEEGANVVKKRIKNNIFQYKVETANRPINVNIELKIGVVCHNGNIKDVFELQTLAEKNIEYDV